MSDTAAATLILPFLAVLVLTLDGLRMGCTRTMRMWQGRFRTCVEDLPALVSVEA